MTKNSTRSNGNPAPLPSRLKDYYSLLKMKRQIMASSNALDGLDTDTVHAIAASLPSGRTEGNIALSVIGGKLSVKSANPDSQTRTARRRVRGLVQAQARGLVLFIEVTPGGRRADGLDNPHHYRDHLSPAANEAWEVFLRRCQQEDWKALSGAQRNQEFKRIALEALNPLRLYGPPAPAPAPTPTDRKAAPLKLKPVDYAIEQERKQLDSIQSTLNQLLLADEEQALSYLKHLRESVTVIYHQTLRTARNETRGGEPSELSPLPDMSPTLVYPPPASRDPLSEIEPLPAPAPAPAPAVHTSREGGGGHNVPLAGWASRYESEGWKCLLVYAIADNGGCTCPAGVQCENPGKHPRGGPYRVQTLRQVTEAAKSGRWNLGIQTGPDSGIDVLDFDGSDGLSLYEDFEQRGWITADVRRCATGGGGVHLPIIHLPGLLPKNDVKLLPGLDVRTQGGLIVTAPSTHKSGGVYRWHKWEGPVLNPSPEFREFLSAQVTALAAAQAKKRLSTTAPTPASVSLSPGFEVRGWSDGERHRELFRVAAALWGRTSRTEADILSELEARAALCSPPLPASTARQALLSCRKYARP